MLATSTALTNTCKGFDIVQTLIHIRDSHTFTSESCIHPNNSFYSRKKKKSSLQHQMNCYGTRRHHYGIIWMRPFFCPEMSSIFTHQHTVSILAPISPLWNIDQIPSIYPFKPLSQPDQVFASCFSPFIFPIPSVFGSQEGGGLNLSLWSYSCILGGDRESFLALRFLHTKAFIHRADHRAPDAGRKHKHFILHIPKKILVAPSLLSFLLNTDHLSFFIFTCFHRDYLRIKGATSTLVSASMIKFNPSVLVGISFLWIGWGYQMKQIHNLKPVRGEEKTCFKNGGFLKTSQLHNDSSTYSPNSCYLTFFPVAGEFFTKTNIIIFETCQFCPLWKEKQTQWVTESPSLMCVEYSLVSLRKTSRLVSILLQPQ
ncbi:hypothetical protein VP01_5260g1 [Puccinia sorghi]|uniref:Uncharacterized protein n=1 Tax=Puccinia sorghi TaxID=27349 RepID=A0A0L6UME9_9BASI|nr:hypothetical protein VP01_5260g1 [Puccinia sorghi]